MEKQKDPTKVKKGRVSKAQGNAFELRVREDLEEKGWVVDKWTNNVEFIKEIDEIKSNKMANHYLQGQVDYLTNVVKGAFRGNLARAKNKWAGPGRPMMMGAGFPDFIAFKEIMGFPDKKDECILCCDGYNDTTYGGNIIIGVESKLTGELDKQEKEKCKWLLDNKIFSKILIAQKTKVKNKVVIVYHDFMVKYNRFYK
jgi:hypothetical protein